MEKLKIYLKRPYEEKGIIKATLDLCLRFFTLGVWGYLMFILGRLLLDALLHEYDPLIKMWWFAYCFILFVGASWIAYIVLFLRDYYEEES